MFDPSPYRAAIRSVELTPRVGRVKAYGGLVVESRGPDTFLGEVCEIYSPTALNAVEAEVVGFRDDAVLLMPCGEVHGIRPGSEVLATGKAPQIAIGEALLGRIVDPFGRPLDGKGPVDCTETVSLRAESLNPVRRGRISSVFETGVKVIDCCLAVGLGQRMGIFSGSGVGKSTVMGMIARHSSADVNVIAMIGERGREVREFIEEQLGEGLKKSVVVVATADQPALVRTRAAAAAIAMAEYFRDRGTPVAFFLDSLTRLAMAQREIGLAAGEPPTARGYTPSVFSMMPRLLERAGVGHEGSGSITAFFTILVEGDELNEPVSDHARAILDGHIVLSRKLAQQGQFPAVDLLQSISRLGRTLNDKRSQGLADDCLALTSLVDGSRDMVDFGAYKEGVNPRLDRALKLAPRLAQFFRQRPDESVRRTDAMGQLASLLGPAS